MKKITCFVPDFLVPGFVVPAYLALQTVQVQATTWPLETFCAGTVTTFEYNTPETYRYYVGDDALRAKFSSGGESLSPTRRAVHRAGGVHRKAGAVTRASLLVGASSSWGYAPF